jgi:hypothetical protein
MPTAPVIETQALTNVFGPQRALDGVNLTVVPGAIAETGQTEDWNRNYARRGGLGEKQKLGKQRWDQRGICGNAES